MVGVIFVSQAAIITQLGNWRVIPEPERLTELYFTDYAALPKSVVAGSKVTIAFTVHNLEHQQTTYHYKLIATSDTGAEQSLGSGTFMLNHDDSHSGSADIVVPAFEPRMTLKVELYYQAIKPSNNAQDMQTQSINFWAAVTDPSKATL